MDHMWCGVAWKRNGILESVKNSLKVGKLIYLTKLGPLALIYTIHTIIFLEQYAGQHTHCA